MLARHGFADLLDQIDLPMGIRNRLAPSKPSERNVWVRIRLVLEDLGPAFVKVGQSMSMRPDALPAPLILELRKLQDQVRPVPFAEIKPVLVEELPGGPGHHLLRIRRDEVASASLAQVYFGRLRADGRKVAVKVQRPNIRKTIQIDLDFAAWIADQLHQRMATLRPYDLPAVMAEVREGIAAGARFRQRGAQSAVFQHAQSAPRAGLRAGGGRRADQRAGPRDGPRRRHAGRPRGLGAGAGPPPGRLRRQLAGAPDPDRRLLPRRSPRRQRVCHGRRAPLLSRLGPRRASDPPPAPGAGRLLGGRGRAGRQPDRANCPQPRPGRRPRGPAGDGKGDHPRPARGAQFRDRAPGTGAGHAEATLHLRPARHFSLPGLFAHGQGHPRDRGNRPRPWTRNSTSGSTPSRCCGKCTANGTARGRSTGRCGTSCAPASMACTTCRTSCTACCAAWKTAT